jgi:hypothetical protein
MFENHNTTKKSLKTPLIAKKNGFFELFEKFLIL